MKYNSDNNGFSGLLVLLFLVILLTISFVGYKVLSNHAKAPLHATPVSSTDPNIGSFSDCAKAGGEVLTIGAPTRTDVQLPANTPDSTATGLYCHMTGNVTKTDETWYAYKELGFDATCKDAQACTAIVNAAKSVCSSTYGLAVNSYNPTFLYAPLIMGGYAKLQVSDCSSNHYRVQPLGTLFLEKTSSSWLIYKFLSTGSSCTSIDYTVLPPELTYNIACQ